MRNAVRLFKFIWPQRARLAWSAFFALIVAALWGANLTVVYPVVKVLVEQENLHEWVGEEIAECRDRIETADHRIDKLKPELVSRRARSHVRLTSEHKKLAGLMWLKSDVLPLVPTDNFQAILLISLVFFIATIIRGLCTVAQTVLVGSVAERSSMQLRNACFRHCLSLDYHTLQETGSTEIVSRMTNDVRELAAGLRVFGIRLIREPLKAIVCLVLAFAWNWRLALLSVIFAPLIGVLIGYCGKHLKKASKAALQSLSGIYQVASETFQNSKIIIACHGGRRQRQRFHEQNKSLYRNSMRGVRIGALISPANEVLGVMAATAAILPAVYMVFRGTTEVWGIKLASAPMEMADVAMLYGFLAGTLDPIHKMSGIYRDWKKATAASDRVLEIFDRESHVSDPATAVTFPRHTRNIRFEAVSYGYPGEDKKPGRLALNEIDVEITAGEVVAVVGPNGCGKSTLVSLLMRFADPLSGSILIDGLDLTSLDTRDLRSQMGFVMQETLLFDATVRENIQYGDPSANDDKIEAAANAANVTSFLERLPDGIDSPVGENGTRLSGGQRQRIAFARALVRDPSILILDEATSAIDAHSESLIYQSLRDCAKDRTVLIITHALSPALLDLVDRILVMESGRVVAEGSHEELSRTCQFYAKLSKSTSREAA